MKIVEIIPTLGSGGAERFVVDLSNKLRASGNDVQIIVLSPLKNGYNIYEKDIHPSINIISLNKNKGFSLYVLFKMLLLLYRINPDIVHSHLNSYFYILFPSLIKLRKISFVHTIHNDADKDAGSAFFGKIMKLSFKYKKVIPITISKESADSFNCYYGFNSFATIYNGRTIKNGVVTEDVKTCVNKVKNSPKTKVILFAARFADQKRPYLNAKVCDMLYREGYDISLMMFGEDCSHGFYTEQINNLHSDCVHMFGVTSSVLEYMKEADAFLLLSSFEGLPIALIEALGVGCIPICTPVGGIKNIIKSGYNGFLAKDCSESACYNVVKEFLETNEDDLNRIRLKTLDSFKYLSMDRCCDEYISIYEKLLC